LWGLLCAGVVLYWLIEHANAGKTRQCKI
jgi:hypothetical protein